jgi:hypothetical protein
LVEGTAADDVCPHGEQFYNCDIPECTGPVGPDPEFEGAKTVSTDAVTKAAHDFAQNRGKLADDLQAQVARLQQHVCPEAALVAECRKYQAIIEEGDAEIDRLEAQVARWKALGADSPVPSPPEEAKK